MWQLKSFLQLRSESFLQHRLAHAEDLLCTLRVPSSMASVSRWGVCCIMRHKVSMCANTCNCAAAAVLRCHAQQQHHQCPAGLFHLCPFLEFSPLTICNGILLHHLSDQDDSGMKSPPSFVVWAQNTLFPQFKLWYFEVLNCYLFVGKHFC